MKNIEENVSDLLKPIIEDLGYILYDVIYEKEAKDYYLRIIIDSKEGISLNDCQKVNDAITDILDEKDLIPNQYFLEVSSPGIERNLRKTEHYLSSLDKKICVKLYQKAENGKKEIIGVLKSIDEGSILINEDENQIRIDKKNIATAKTVYDW